MTEQPKETRTVEEIRESLKLGELPSPEEIDRLSAEIPGNSAEYKTFVKALETAHTLALMRSTAETGDPLDHLVDREGWPNTRAEVEIVLQRVCGISTATI